jgi:uncharacterized protein YneF (UPF0154 family)
MDDLMMNMLRDREPIAKHLIRELWLDIGQQADYDKAQKVYETHFKEAASS